MQDLNWQKNIQAKGNLELMMCCQFLMKTYINSQNKWIHGFENYYKLRSWIIHVIKMVSSYILLHSLGIFLHLFYICKQHSRSTYMIFNISLISLIMLNLPNLENLKYLDTPVDIFIRCFKKWKNLKWIKT